MLSKGIGKVFRAELPEAFRPNPSAEATPSIVNELERLLPPRHDTPNPLPPAARPTPTRGSSRIMSRTCRLIEGRALI